ncbi:hypothetical protein [Streptacidiphilus sp. P02-A3a]|uniref:hypothetical protein n=1 Tax=Streptacidiphilus sp. P02-A3a TaxID=2704468 RepID=UPI0015FB29EB|nr:hypothetical protein [Streptacidiphilus sp. P02-A3a]QMU67518.1 hypothetical protein GXP74_04040 [Streptacidiphilus sp. P02-A3a]
MNHRRPNFDELTPDDLFRPEPMDGSRTGGTIAGEVLYSSREPIPPNRPEISPAQQTQMLPQPWDGQQPPQQPSGQPEYFGDATGVGPAPGAMGPGPMGPGAMGGGTRPDGGEASTQFLPPFPAAPVDRSGPTTVGQWQPQPQPGYGGGYQQQPGYDGGYQEQPGYEQGYDQGYQPGYAEPQPYPQPAQPSYGQQVPYGQPTQSGYDRQPPYGQQAGAGYPGGGYSGGGTGAGGPGGAGGGRGGRRFSNRAIAIAAIAVCAVLGVGAAALAAGGGSGSGTAAAAASSSSTPSASAGAVGESTVQAQALSDLLATAANGRSAVIAAVGNVDGCRSLSQSQKDLTTAAGLRQQLIQQLALLQTDQLSHGTELVAELRRGWQASADADTHYAAWAGQSAASCAHTHKPVSGGELAQGDAASGTASEAKAKASKLWDAIAAATGMPKRSGSQL